ncbi:hypothetical protein [Streptomyces sp. NPDC048603]|uniref:SCO2400 family protein n=1 Tax=Streptomyces sp. NPDC048603 TaxID=3365577 RepID=UPI00371B7D3F
MDYCHACHRYLNGALACAGCGTPAEYLAAAPAAAVPVSVPEGGAGAGAGAGAGDRAGRAAGDPYAPEGPADELSVVLGGAYQGRGQARGAARRKAVQRRRRRTALTAGLGLLVAAGGAVLLGQMTAGPDVQDRASTVLLQEDSGPQEPEPEPTGTSGVETVAPSLGQAPKASARPGRAARTTTGSGAPDPGVSEAPEPDGTEASAEPTASATGPSPGGSASPRPSSKKSGKPKSTSSGGASPTSSTSQSPRPVPTPSPSPTKECQWWQFFGC